MTDRAQRLIIALDEWLGIVVLLYLHRFDPSLFWPFLVAWAVAVYGLSYPPYWIAAERRYDIITPLRPLLAAARAMRRGRP